MSDKVNAEHLDRKAILYVRQSTGYQVLHNIESQRLQYAMQEKLTELGFRQVEVFDEDLGQTASGFAERRGFERLVTEVCLGKVGAVAARDLSRFARNSREWHHLVEMCRFVNTLLVDQESVFDPRLSNDRLLLGLKGDINSYELDRLRQLSLEAQQAKAARGELYQNLPAGYVRGIDCPIVKDPDRRVQRALELVFAKLLEIGTLRQTLLWFLQQELEVPVKDRIAGGWETGWRRPTLSVMSRILNNPVYAGAYVRGRRKVVFEVEGGEVKKRCRQVPMEKWEVLIFDHHEGYITRETFERIRQMLAKNRPGGQFGGAPKKGRSLLTGLLRCRRCGRRLRVTYTGEPRVVRYFCDRGSGVGGQTCISFGGNALEAAVEAEVLRVVAPGALEAAAQATTAVRQAQGELVEALRLDLEAARFAADHARRQYDAVDPANRLVADELEARWNAAMVKAAELEQRIATAEAEQEQVGLASVAELKGLARELPRVWHEPQTDIRLKKRIVRTLVEEVLVDVDAEAAQIKSVIHWKGGVHTEVSVKRRRRGQTSKSTSKDIVDAVRVLARVCGDGPIAQVLSRNDLKTGQDNPWTKIRVKSLRSYHQIPVYDEQRQVAEGWMTLNQAAAYVEVSAKTLRLAAERGEVEALHPLPHGPWVLKREDLDRAEVRERFERIRKRRQPPAGPDSEEPNLTIPGT